MVPKKGLEPPHPCGYMDLNHARLPIPPLRRVTLRIVTSLAGRCRGRTILYSTDDEGRVKRSPIANTYNRRTERNPLARRIAMTNPQKLPPDVANQLRELVHDLSNSIETIMQASYLLGQTEMPSHGKNWVELIAEAAQNAAQINRQLREVLRGQR